MLEKPAVQESSIINCLRDQYGLDSVTLEFLPIGNDVNTAVYHIEAGNQGKLYMKLRRDDFNHASVIIPHLLKKNGIKQVIAPLLTNDQKEWTTLDKYSLALYPYIEGKNSFHHPLSNDQWIELGTALKGLHELQIPQELKVSIPHENYSSMYRDEIKKIIQYVHKENFVDNVAMQLANFIKENEEKINHIAKRSEELSVEIKKKEKIYVLCHADLHGANVLIDENNALYIVDWDTLTFAPKERDLMFIGGGVGGSWNKKEETELFYKGYGHTKINYTVLIYYRYERIVEDIVEFSKRLLLTNEGGKDRVRSLEKFKNAFMPNDVVEIAIREEKL